MTGDLNLRHLMATIAAGDEPAALALLVAAPDLATAALLQGATRAAAMENFLPDIAHHLYAGDTALHVAAAAHRPAMVRALVERGAVSAPETGVAPRRCIMPPTVAPARCAGTRPASPRPSPCSLRPAPTRTRSTRTP